MMWCKHNFWHNFSAKSGATAWYQPVTSFFSSLSSSVLPLPAVFVWMQQTGKVGVSLCSCVLLFLFSSLLEVKPQWCSLTLPPVPYPRKRTSPAKDEHMVGVKDSLLAHSSDPVEMRRLNYQTQGAEMKTGFSSTGSCCYPHLQVEEGIVRDGTSVSVHFRCWVFFIIIIIFPAAETHLCVVQMWQKRNFWKSETLFETITIFYKPYIGGWTTTSTFRTDLFIVN